MKLKIDCEKIAPLFESYGEFVDEAVVKINQNGLESVATDSAMVCVYSIRIPKEKFDVFEVENEMKLGLNLSSFVSILKRAGNDKITLESDGKRLAIRMKNRTFTVGLYDLPESEIPPVEQLNFASSFRIKSEILATAVSDGKLNSDAVWFETCNDGVRFCSEGDVSSNEIILERGNENLLEMKGKAKALYPINYLERLKIGKISDDILVEFSENFPCKISFLNGFFVLAPRVEGNEEEVEKTS
jgi:DNA polymerase III sliding clamp (beta) subunit (PCNA family)